MIYRLIYNIISRLLPKRKSLPVLSIAGTICPVCKKKDFSITETGLCENCGNIVF